MRVFLLISQKLCYPKKCSLNTKIGEFLMKRIGSQENGNILAFSANCRKSLVRAFRKKTPQVSVDAGGWGAKGATDNVRSLVTFL